MTSNRIHVTREEIIRTRDLSSIMGSNIKAKEFFETRDTIDKSLPIVKKYFEVKKLKTIYDFTSGHTFNGLYALARNQCNNIVSVDLHFPRAANIIQSYYPRLMARMETREEDIYRSEYNISDQSAVLSIHPCNNLAYRVCDIAIENRVPIILVPCCVAKGHPSFLDAFGLNSNTKHELKLAHYLSTAGYDIRICKITERATPRNTIIIGLPKV